MSAKTGLVLVTGATGFIGFRTLVEVLEAGYSARAAVRNQSGIDKIKSAPTVKPHLSKLEFVLVPDILMEHAYYEAVKDVDFIIHLASPTTNQKEVPTEETFDSIFIQPALQGTGNMLRAAKLYSPTTRRMIITSSVVALVAPSDVVGETGVMFTEDSRTSTPQPPYGNIFKAYSSSKIASLNFSEHFTRTENPHFDVNYIGPGYVIGRNELASTRAELLGGTNRAALSVVRGANEGDTPSTTAFVDDIAKMHVLALDPKVPGGKFFLGVGDDSNTTWDDARAIAQRHFPGAFERGTLSDKGSRATKRLIFDNRFTKETLGIEFASYEVQVKSVVEQYLALPD